MPLIAIGTYEAEPFFPLTHQGPADHGRYAQARVLHRRIGGKRLDGLKGETTAANQIRTGRSRTRVRGQGDKPGEVATVYPVMAGAIVCSGTAVILGPNDDPAKVMRSRGACPASLDRN